MSSNSSLPLSTTSRLVAVVLIQLLLLVVTVSAFVVPQKAVSTPMLNFPSHASSSSSSHSSRYNNNSWSSALASSSEDSVRGVIDLTDDDDDEDEYIGPDTTQRSEAVTTTTAPFLSQGELSSDPNLLNPDFSDDKQNRVILYIILTLVPILFLVPLMIGSRDLIPLDVLPPVELT